nr:hypothetical protein CFP56_66456 [Quercus suber]
MNVGHRWLRSSEKVREHVLDPSETASGNGGTFYRLLMELENEVSAIEDDVGFRGIPTRLHVPRSCRNTEMYCPDSSFA